MDNYLRDQRISSDLAAIKDKLDVLHKDIVFIKRGGDTIKSDPILDFYETCQMLHLSERQVRRLREEKKLTGFLVGSRRMYRYSEIKQFIEQAENKARHYNPMK